VRLIYRIPVSISQTGIFLRSDSVQCVYSHAGFTVDFGVIERSTVLQITFSDPLHLQLSAVFYVVP